MTYKPDICIYHDNCDDGFADDTEVCTFDTEDEAREYFALVLAG